MPKVLRAFLEGLSHREADVVAEWLDEAVEPAVQMVAVIVNNRERAAVEAEERAEHEHELRTEEYEAMHPEGRCPPRE